MSNLVTTHPQTNPDKMLIFCGLCDDKGEELTFEDYRRREVSVADAMQFRAMFEAEQEWGLVTGMLLCGLDKPVPDSTLRLARMWLDRPLFIGRGEKFFVGAKLGTEMYQIARKLIVPYSLVVATDEELEKYGAKGTLG